MCFAVLFDSFGDRNYSALLRNFLRYYLGNPFISHYSAFLTIASQAIASRIMGKLKLYRT